jgi:cell division protein FtsB
LGILVLVPAVLYALYTVAEKSVETYRLRYQAAVVRAEIEASKAENLRLQAELVAARGDAQIEDAARRQLNLIKPGDRPVVLIGPLPTASPTPRTVATPQPGDDLPPWLFWMLTRLGL